jgi:hypothetical protein
MHSISPYLLRCFNPHLPGKQHEKYAPLDRVGQYDTFSLLESFITARTTRFANVPESQQVYRFSNMVFDSRKREIYGWFQVGSYGTRTDIIDIENGNVDFEKDQNNAEIINHFIHFYTPKPFNEGIAILHSYRGNGVKTLFESIFKPYFNQYSRLNLQINALSYDKAIEAWQNANAKELKVTRFVGLSDITDQLNSLGHQEQELIIRPKKNGTFGKLKDYFIQGSEQARAVELLSPLGTQVKTVVEQNGKKRTFRVGHSTASSLCEIELDAHVRLEDGNPELSSIHSWCVSIIKEYSVSMYPGLEIEL